MHALVAIRPRVSLLALLVVLPMLLLAEGQAGAGSLPVLSELRTAGFEGRNFSEVDQNQSYAGKHSISRKRAHDGRYALQATIDGTHFAAHSRVVFDGTWAAGETVQYRAAFYLPRGFLANLHAQTDLIRFDNYPDMPQLTERTGVTIYSSDRMLRVFRNKLGVEQEALVGPVAIKDGQWNVIEVRQVLSSTDGQARNELWLNGNLSGTSSTANTYGNPFRRIRYGIVAVGPNQTTPQTLWVDDLSISSGLL